MLCEEVGLVLNWRLSERLSQYVPLPEVTLREVVTSTIRGDAQDDGVRPGGGLRSRRSAHSHLPKSSCEGTVIQQCTLHHRQSIGGEFFARE